MRNETMAPHWAQTNYTYWVIRSKGDQMNRTRRSKLVRRASVGSKLNWENASLSRSAFSKRGKSRSLTICLSCPTSYRSLARAHPPINPSFGAEPSQKLSCHRDGSDWPCTAHAVLPRIRPTFVQHPLDFLEAVDICWP
jgi:hypothetical protein